MDTSSYDEASKRDVETLAKGAGISYLGMFSARGLQALSQILLARFLGPEMFGLYALGWVTLRLVGDFSPLGLDKGIIRFGSIFWRKKDFPGLNSIVYRTAAISVLSGSILSIFTFIGADILSGFLEEPGLTPVLRIFALAFPALAVLRVLTAGTRITQRIQYSMYSEMLGRSGSNLILILVIVFIVGAGVIGASYATVLSVVVGLILAIFFIIKLFPSLLTLKRSTTIRLRELLRFSIPIALATIFFSLTIWTSRLFIGYFLTSAEIGIFQAIAQAAFLFVITQQAINMIFSPMIAELYEAGHRNRLNELFKVSAKWTLYISIPIYLILLFMSAEFMNTLFGSEYADSSLILIIIATGQLINVASGSVGFILMMTGHESRWLLISMLSFLVSFLLNWLLIPLFGLTGAAIATAAGIAIINVVGLISVRRLEGFWPYDKRYLKGIFASLVAAAALWIFGLFPIYSSLASILISGVLAFAAFGGTLFLMGLDQEDQAFLDLAKRRVKVYFPQ